MVKQYAVLALLAMVSSSGRAQDQDANNTLAIPTPNDPSTEESVADEQGCIGPGNPGELMDALMEGYDKRVRPSWALSKTKKSSAVPPENARISLHVLSLTDVNQKTNEFELSVYFIRIWDDPRLAYKTEAEGGCFSENGIGFQSSFLDNIWKPDFLFENQVDKVGLIGEAVYVDPSGTVWWESQLELKLACKMEFKDFPYDIQVCGFGVGLFAESSKHVLLEFEETDVGPPVTLQKDYPKPKALPQGGTPEWEILKAEHVMKDIITWEGVTDGEGWSSVEYRFHLKRNSEYYANFVVQPCVMFVAIGYASFFVSRNAAPARVGMSTIGFLANTNFLVAQLGQIPRLGRDVFLLKFVQMCAWFSFYCIIEYALCNYLRRIQGRLDAQRKKMSENAAAYSKLNNTDDGETGEGPREREPKEDGEKKGAYKGFTKDDIIASGFNRKMDLLLLNPKTGKMYLRDEHVDIFSRYVYPFAYLAGYLGLWYSK